MPNAFFTFIGRLYGGFVSIAISVVLGLAVWLSWGLYREEALDGRFRREGQSVTVTVEQTSDRRQTWRDALHNVTYLSFHYRRQPYTVRFVADTLRVGEGEPVSLLYHPGLDAFRQPPPPVRLRAEPGTSRLVRWSVTDAWRPESIGLALFVGLCIVFFVFSSGTVGVITGRVLLPGVGYPLLVVLLLGGTAFLTYDAWQYVQYYGRLKANGRPVAVHVTGTDRAAYYRRQSRYGKSYRYTARVQCNGQERVIPLEEAGYEALRPGDRLAVLYDPSLEDMMPVDYPMDYREFISLAFAWLVSLYFLGRKLFRRARAQPTPPA
jgi:hypothetical protein